MADRIFRALLRLLPRSYDALDREEMWETYRTRIDHARVNGRPLQVTADRVRVGLDGEPLESIDLRTAAFVVAVDRVARVSLDRGIWP